MDRSQINDRSAPAVGGSTGGGSPAMGGTTLTLSYAHFGHSLEIVTTKVVLSVPFTQKTRGLPHVSVRITYPCYSGWSIKTLQTLALNYITLKLELIKLNTYF